MQKSLSVASNGSNRVKSSACWISAKRCGECPHTPGSAPLHCPGEVVASEETHEKSLSGWEREGLSPDFIPMLLTPISTEPNLPCFYSCQTLAPFPSLHITARLFLRSFPCTLRLSPDEEPLTGHLPLPGGAGRQRTAPFCWQSGSGLGSSKEDQEQTARLLTQAAPPKPRAPSQRGRSRQIVTTTEDSCWADFSFLQHSEPSRRGTLHNQTFAADAFFPRVPLCIPSLASSCIIRPMFLRVPQRQFGSRGCAVSCS
ncbi:hypothetical protein Anapl_07695 [Anas platyrhynchos]|uniref:Uncharacterized protein n=1 Tax=Anas platyrhynchos TaxID=8839 RepID=R0L9J6_ANAPL|nr:hypothetical protein Anapl_07695 [Anas platyrhynchos]